MSKRAWMPLYVGDYLGDTGHLSTTQHGAYLLLMMHYWRKEELPDDDKQLAAITKLPLRIWMDMRETLQAFFYDGWRHKRIDAEIEKMTKVSLKRSAAGFKGGIRSSISRSKLEGEASKSQPIAKQLLKADSSNCSDFAQAELHHSHSHLKNSKSKNDAKIEASPELIASLSRRH